MKENRLSLILGIGQRSGTNYLYRLLAQHPRVNSQSPIREDFFVHNLSKLNQYVDGVHRYWNPKWQVDEKIQSHEKLQANLGSGLVGFIRSTFTETSEASDCYLSKTPSVRCLQDALGYLGDTRIVVIIRDGRDLVESGMRSFDWSFEAHVRKWAEGANVINAVREHPQVLVVSYEDLYQNQSEVLTRVMDFLELDAAVFDFEAAQNMGVYGSSGMREKSGEVNWEPKQKDTAFNPICRWSGWSHWRKQRFDYLAGEQLELLGYDRGALTSTSSIHWSMLNILADYRWKFVFFGRLLVTLCRAFQQKRLRAYVGEFMTDHKEV